MVVSAHDVAAALRARLPGLGTIKLHKLLYYCQGHHLAAFGTPLFAETISAWDMGPVVGTLWRDEKDGRPPPVRATLDEAALNTVGYVVSRYGGLTGHDLRRLTHGETPWRQANRDRRPHESAEIRVEWLRESFTAAGADDDEVVLDPAVVGEWLADADERRGEPVTPDTREAIRARLIQG